MKMKQRYKEETEEHNSSKNENKKKLWVAYELPL